MHKIDAHQHFWDLQRFRYPWLSAELGVLFRDYLPGDLEPALRECGVDATIVVQATHARQEAEWFLALARTAPFIKGVVGWLDLTAPDLEQQIDVLRAQGPLCGIRHQVHDEPDPQWLLGKPVLNGLRTLARKGLAYDLLVRPVHLAVLPRLFAALPDARWVVDHIAKPPIASGELEPWLQGLRRVASYPNVYCKLSGMITEADLQHWTSAQIRPYVEHVLELFTPARLMYGSDWPVCLLAGSYRQVHDLLAELIAALSASEQAAIWGATARQVYGIELEAPAR